MYDLVPIRTFEDTGNTKREKEDLTYMHFLNLRQENTVAPISFFRSDFRGSSFSNCYFFNNNFDRADFIACIFGNCCFDNVNIAASEIKNCYFYDTVFRLNHYNHTSVQESTFENCEFRDEHLLVNMKNCTFINCKLNSCSFERSTTESVSFSNCQIKDSDMATMHAEGHKFSNCQIENTSMGISYIFSYLFYNTDLSNIKILYRGDEIKLTKEAISHQAKLLWRERRLHEFLNANIICGNVQQVPHILHNILDSALSIAPQLRKLEISNLFFVLQFCSQNSMFPYPIYMEILECLEQFGWKQFSSEERIIYLSGCEKLKLFVREGCYNNDFVLTAMETQSTLIIHCKTDDYDAAKEATYDFLNDLSKALGISSGFELIDEQKGSWIFTFVVITALALVIPKMVSETVNVSLEISTKVQIKKRLKAKLKKQNLSTDELKTIAEIASNAGLVKGSSVQITPSDLVNALKIQL